MEQEIPRGNKTGTERLCFNLTSQLSDTDLDMVTKPVSEADVDWFNDVKEGNETRFR